MKGQRAEKNAYIVKISNIMKVLKLDPDFIKK